MRRIRFIRGMGFFDSVMLGVGFIIGSGIFLMPLLAAEAAGTWSILAWIIGGFYQLLTGLSFAECAIKVPKAGGLYAYAHKAFGDVTGFFTGWTFWIGYIITIAAEQWAIGYYLQFFLPTISLIVRVTVGAATGLVLAYLNYRGVKTGGRIGDWLTVGKLIAIAIFIVGAALVFKLVNFYPVLPSGASLVPAVGSATILVLYAYLGEEIITVPEEEIQNAKKTVPKAVIVSAVSTMAIYLIVVVLFLGASSWTNFVGSEAPLSSLFSMITGSTIGGIVITVGVLVSVIGALNAVILGSARISYSMSRDGLFPQVFGRLHPKHNTPYASIIVQTVLALILTYSVNSFSSLAVLAILFTLVPYMFSSFATLRLVGGAGGKLDVLHTRATPAIAGIASLVLLAAFWNDTSTLEMAAVILFIGLLVFIERKKIRKL